MINYARAVSEGFPGVQFTVYGDGSIYEEFEWVSGTPPTKDELDAYIIVRTKELMWENIKNERDRRKLELGYKVGNYWYHSDTTSRIQQIALLLLGANIPGNLLWKTMSGEFVQMTQSLAGQIFQAAVISDSVLFGVAEQKRSAMMVSQDPASYNYLSGWPVGFGE